jgi:hypothetical protein
LVSLDLPLQCPCMAHAFFPKCLSNQCQSLCYKFFRDLHIIWCILTVGSTVKSHQARYTIPNKRTYEISTFTQLHETMYTDSQDMLVLPSTATLCYYNCCTHGSIIPDVKDTGTGNSPLMLSLPYRGGGVWVLPRPWELYRR